VTVDDASSVHTWSGTPRAMVRGLASTGLDVQSVGGLRTALDKPLWLAERVSERLAATARRRPAWPAPARYRAGRSPVLARAQARAVEDRLRSLRPDAVVSPGTIPVAHLGGDLPVAVWTDACFGAMLGYYPQFTGLSRRTVREGHDLERRAYRRASLVAFSSQWAADSARTCGDVDPGKVHVIPFGANLDDPPSRESALRWARERPRDSCRLLLIGVDWERKGVPLAIAVTARLRDAGLKASLTVVGCRPPAGVKVPSFVAVKGFLSKTTTAGREELQRELREAHCFVLPSLAECFGIAYAEAAAYAVPSFARSTGGVSTAVIDGVTGRVFPREATAEEYARSILDTMNERDTYLRYAEAARDDFETRLNWGVATRRLADLLQNVI
jgi:glycosyltransferase involved in cell wall biosynthesis